MIIVKGLEQSLAIVETLSELGYPVGATSYEPVLDGVLLNLADGANTKDFDTDFGRLGGSINLPCHQLHKHSLFLEVIFGEEFLESANFQVRGGILRARAALRFNMVSQCFAKALTRLGLGLTVMSM